MGSARSLFFYKTGFATTPQSHCCHLSWSRFSHFSDEGMRALLRPTPKRKMPSAKRAFLSSKKGVLPPKRRARRKISDRHKQLFYFCRQTLMMKNRHPKSLETPLPDPSYHRKKTKTIWRLGALSLLVGAISPSMKGSGFRLISPFLENSDVTCLTSKIKKAVKENKYFKS